MTQDAVEISFAEDGAQRGFASREVWVDQGDSARQRPAFIANFSGRTLNLVPAARSTSLQHGVVLDRFNDVVLTWSRCLFHGNQLHTSYYGQAQSFADVLTGPYAGTSIAESAGVMRDGDVYTIDRSRFEQAVTVDDACLLVTPDEPVTWGMWVLDALPAIAHFAANRHRYKRLVAIMWHPNVFAMMRAFGIADHEILQQDHQRSYRFKDLSLIRQSFRTLRVPRADRLVFRSLAMQLSQTNLPRRIYVSRKLGGGLNASRELRNEDALIAGLESIGITAIYPATMTFEEQVAVFGAADFVVGLGGSAMFSTAFCRPDARIVDLESTEIFLEAHCNMLAGSGGAYGMIIGEADPGDAVHRPWVIDVAATVDLVSGFGR